MSKRLIQKLVLSVGALLLAISIGASELGIASSVDSARQLS